MSVKAAIIVLLWANIVVAFRAVVTDVNRVRCRQGGGCAFFVTHVACGCHRGGDCLCDCGCVDDVAVVCAVAVDPTCCVGRDRRDVGCLTQRLDCDRDRQSVV